MVQRSSTRFMAMMFGALSLTAACQPAGVISGGELPEESANAYDDEPASALSAPVLGVVARDSGAREESTSSADAGVAVPAPTFAPTGADAAVPSPTPTPALPAATSSKTLRTDGARILDTCGQPFVARGMEQLAAKPFSRDGTYETLVAELVKTGSNAVRLLPRIDEVSASDIDKMLTAFAAQRVVVYISPGDRSWFARPEIRTVLLKHEKGLILDAFQEPDYNDVNRWRNETKAAIAEVRAAGYTCPITVLVNHYGRDLKSGLTHGQEIVDTDSAHNTIIGWQAYWGKSGYYQSVNNMSLAQGVEAAAKNKFPVQVGIDLNADADDEMDYREVMAAAQKHGVSWLWWNFWNQWDGWNNNASNDGSAENLTAAGQVVVHSDANSIEKTAKKACFK